jgi:hypothetical protein
VQLGSRPATRYCAAGAPQPVIAPRLLTACATLQLTAAGEFSRCVANHLFESYTSRSEYSMRCIREQELATRPGTRCFAAGATQPIIAPRLLTACATLQLPAAGEFSR